MTHVLMLCCRMSAGTSRPMIWPPRAAAPRAARAHIGHKHQHIVAEDIENSSRQHGGSREQRIVVVADEYRKELPYCKKRHREFEPEGIVARKREDMRVVACAEQL